MKQLENYTKKYRLVILFIVKVNFGVIPNFECHHSSKGH